MAKCKYYMEVPNTITRTKDGYCDGMKLAPRVYCNGDESKCEICNRKEFPKDCGRYLIKKVKNDGTVIWKHEIIKDEELIFTFADIVDEFVNGIIVNANITKFKLDGRSYDGKDSDGK